MHTAIKWITGIVEDTKLKNDDLITLAWKDHILKYVDKTDLDKHYYLNSIGKLPLSLDIPIVKFSERLYSKPYEKSSFASS